jgi:hypothetical protein
MEGLNELIEGLFLKPLTPPEILSSLECPVCLEYAIGIDLYVCSNGHSHCENCHPQLAECPVCKGQIQQTRNIGLQGIADAVVVKCPYSENGCSEHIEVKDYKEHISLCYFG